MKITLKIVIFILLVLPLSLLANNDWCSSNGYDGPYKFEWKPTHQGDFSYGILKIKDISSGQVLQEIGDHGSPEKWTPLFTDYNFDGCPDLSWSEFGDEPRNPNFVILIYDRAQKMFVLSEKLTGLTNLSIENKRSKCISGYNHSGVANDFEEKYCWRGAKLIKTEETVSFHNEQKECLETKKYRLRNNKLKLVSTTCERPG